uniref:Ubiquinol-cytochrome c reductase complex assembly factor 4 n=1 Tax=Poecilia formosa TaxID=48698 RepID=A0A096M9N6_POEFO
RDRDSFNVLNQLVLTSSISIMLTRCLLPLDSLRSLSLTSAAPARSKPSSDDEAVSSEPIKFSTSKASHRTWRVDRSLGSQHERPWWKVVPISLAFTAFLLWCIMRSDTDIDTQLEKHLYEHLPGLEEDEEVVAKQPQSE